MVYSVKGRLSDGRPLVDNGSQYAQIVVRIRSDQEIAMKKLCITAAVVLFGAAPAIGLACDYSSDISASASSTPTPIRTESAAASAAVKAPTPAVAKTAAPGATDKAVVKVKAPATGQKIAASSAN